MGVFIVSSFFSLNAGPGTANKVERTALKVHTPMRSTALMARSLALPDDSSRGKGQTDCEKIL